MPDHARPHEAEQDVVVLLPLEAVHRRHLARPPEQRVVRAPPLDDVTDEVLLAVVRAEDGDLVRGVAQHAHVLVTADDVFGLAQVLEEVRVGLELAAALVVGDVDELELMGEAGVGDLREEYNGVKMTLPGC